MIYRLARELFEPWFGCRGAERWSMVCVFALHAAICTELRIYPGSLFAMLHFSGSLVPRQSDLHRIVAFQTVSRLDVANSV